MLVFKPKMAVLLVSLAVGFSWVISTVSLSLDGVLLLNLKYSLLGDPFGVLSSWNYNDQNPCSWNGVVCVVSDGANASVAESRVVGLVLPNCGLLGSIHGDLGFIEHLRDLDLSGNSFNGTLPSSLFNASELRVISLSDNMISGEIPDLFGNLTSLQSVNLSNNAFSGRIPETLAQLPNLTVLSLSNNFLVGSFTSGFRRAEVVDFSFNLVNGSLPESEFGGQELKYLNLSNNRITGKIPASFGSTFRENVTVDLSYNNLSGAIPAVAEAFAVHKSGAFEGNPDLCGELLMNPCSIPSSLYNPSPNASTASGDSHPAFAAMPKSVGGGADVGNVRKANSTEKVERRSRMKASKIAGIVVGDLVGIGLLLLLFLFFYHLKRRRRKRSSSCIQKSENQLQTNEMIVKSPRIGGDIVNHQHESIVKLWTCFCEKPKYGDDTSETSATETETDENSRRQGVNHQVDDKVGVLVTVDGETELELETLLKASAYILGASGSSIVYKAVFADGTAYAVRRIGNDGSTEKVKDFDAQVRSIAKFRHPNLIRIRGFYWGSDEKLLITDFAPNGSLANITYKKLGSSPFHLRWDVRLRIAKGVAKALAYLHDKKTVHGNLKPNNILLNADMEPMLTDLGLDRLTSNGDLTSRPGSSFRHFGSKRSTLSQGSLHEPSPSPLGGSSSSTPYHAPEWLKNLKLTPKCDVYSFGVVLLELLSGTIFDEEELADWNGTAFVAEEQKRVLRLADGAIRGEVVGNEDMVLNFFRLGFSCTCVAPQRRPSMKEAVQVLERFHSPTTTFIN